jgi:hypothetical protein
MRVRSAVGVLVTLSVLAAVGVGPGASASFVDATPPTTTVVASGTLDAPTGLTAVRGACQILTSVAVNLSWTATGSTFADGYEIFRSTTSGSGYGSLGTVTGRTTTTFVDPTVSFLTTYYYVVQAKKHAWRSANSNQAQVTTPTPLCI